MGILNVTPDSFSDGGHYLDCAAAIEHGLVMAAEGADIIDVGGESTRPGSEPVGATEELARVVPVIEGLRAAGVAAAISVDTSKPQVAVAALDAGASFVNDVTALRAEGMAELVAERGVECCLVHMRGDPLTMQNDPRYGDVVQEVGAFLRERVAAAVAAGVPPQRILVDPGIGFGKTVEHNLELLDRLGELGGIGQGVLIGTSRKSFLGALAGERKRDRLAGTIATNVIALLRGASVFRVHDVAAVRDALDVAAATVRVR
jgi:dihydropteroate synthase